MTQRRMELSRKNVEIVGRNIKKVKNDVGNDVRRRHRPRVVVVVHIAERNWSCPHSTRTRMEIYTKVAGSACRKRRNVTNDVAINVQRKTRQALDQQRDSNALWTIFATRYVLV